jgi:hypothetical protein
MTRNERRALRRRAIDLVDRFKLVDLPPHLDLLRHVAIIRESSPLILMNRDDAKRVLALFGVDDMIDEIETQRPPATLAVVVIVGALARLEFMNIALVPTRKAVA